MTQYLLGLDAGNTMTKVVLFDLQGREVESVRRRNPILFPAAPGDWHWSSTANVNAPAVNQYNYGNIAQGRAGAGGRPGVHDGGRVD